MVDDRPGTGRGDGSSPGNDELLLSMLRDILLREARSDMADLREELENSERLAEKVNPIIGAHIEVMKRKFPKEYRKRVERIVEQRLAASQDELLDVIYPVMGKMIRKYVNHQFVTLRESINERMDSAFSLRYWKNRLMGGGGGDLVLGQLDKARVEEVFVIERDAGLMMGHYSKNETIDRESVAGMLTAIKMFVENAFNKERQELEMIDYDTYRIFLQSFRQYYIAVILNGGLALAEKDALSAKLLDFAGSDEVQAALAQRDKVPQTDTYDQLSMQLLRYFG